MILTVIWKTLISNAPQFPDTGVKPIGIPNIGELSSLTKRFATTKYDELQRPVKVTYPTSAGGMHLSNKLAIFFRIKPLILVKTNVAIWLLPLIGINL